MTNAAEIRRSPDDRSPSDPSQDANGLSESSKRELQSLLVLLDDPDPRTADVVMARLRSHGNQVLSALRSFRQSSSDPLACERAEHLIAEIATLRITDAFEQLSEKLESNARGALEDGAFLIASFGTPDLDREYYRSELSSLAGKLRERIAGIQSPLDILYAVNNFFFEEQRFQGNQTQFLEAENSYIDQVIDRRVGIPISLAVVYLLVARDRLGLPFSGASAPGHFLIRYDGIRGEPLFIDAFNRGVVLRQADIERFLAASRLPFSQKFLAPSDARTILLRMMRNLLLVFKKQKDQHAERAFAAFISILAPHERDSNLSIDDTSDDLE